MRSGLLYSGNYGSFSWEAAHRAQVENPEIVELELIESLDPPTALRRFWSREYSHVLIPIFNPSLGGVIPSSKQGFLELGLPLPEEGTTADQWLARFGELNRGLVLGNPIALPVAFDILALPGVEAKAITRLASYSMALEQCKIGIQRIVGHPFENIPYSDTGKAAHDLRRLSDDLHHKTLDPESARLEPLGQTAVLGPKWCAELFGLQPLWSGVQDLAEGNVTTFILLHHPDAK
jgi:prephenate dehydratase